MPWDFSTEPEFQAKLDWMREFVRERIWPLETLIDELGADGLVHAIRPMAEEVRTQGLWAAHLDPELGGQGFGQVKLGLMHEILGTSPIAPLAFGNQAPDSGNSEILALAGTPEQKERYLHPLFAGDLRSAFSMTEPDTAGSDPTLLQDPRRPRRRRVDHQRPQVVHLQRVDRRLPDRDGGVGSGRQIAPACLDVHRRRGRSGRPGRARRGHDGAPVGELRSLRQPRGGALRGRPRARRGAAGSTGRRVPHRPAAAVSGPDPSLHAVARGGATRVRHVVRALAVSLRARLVRWPRTRPSRTGSRTQRPRCRPRG